MNIFLGLKLITGLVKIIADIHGDITDIKMQIENGTEYGEGVKNLEIRYISLKSHYKMLQRPMHFLYEQVIKKNWYTLYIIFIYYISICIFM